MEIIVGPPISFFINIEKPRNFFVPTGFTPNDDQLNDLLITHGDEMAKVIYWKIFDRWGNQVFIAENFEVGNSVIGWNGKYKNRLADPASICLDGAS